MNCARNIVTANFSGGGTSATTAPLWQWDYGQVLCITGLDLPAAFEVHFSTNRTGGVSTVAVGADGQVTIHNELLTIGKNLNAWIYLSDAQGEGETEYSILIPVKARPMPETYDAEVSGEFDDVVRQVSEYAETAQTAADNAGASASAAAASADNAAASASAAETAKTAAETAQGNVEDAQAAAETAAQTATQKAEQTAQDAAQAAQSKADAESAAQRAEAAQTGAESAKTDAETAAQGAADSASAASASATSAGQATSAAAQSATAAAQSAASIEGDVQTATQKAAEATAAADQAVAAKDAAVTAQTAAETAASTAAANATTASTKAAEAAQSATDAAASETAAEAAATRAETAAATLTVDNALSDTSVNPVQNKVITGEVAQLKSAKVDKTGVGQVTPQNLQIVDAVISPNLFNPDDAVAGYYITKAGVLTESSSFFTTGYIPVEAGEQYVFNYSYQSNRVAALMRMVACYDASKTVMPDAGSNTKVSQPYTIPSGVSFVRVSTYQNTLFTEFQFEKGTVGTAYKPYGLLSAKIYPQYLPDDDVDMGKIPAFELVQGQNLLNRDDPDFLTEKYIAKSGAVSTNTAFVASGYIAVSPGESIVGGYKAASGNTVRAALSYIACYDSTKTVMPDAGVNGYTDAVFVVPDGVAFVRVSMYERSYGQYLQIEKSNSNYPKPYVPYEEPHYELKQDYMYPLLGAPDYVYLPSDLYVAVGRTIELYNSQVVLDHEKYRFQWVCARGKAVSRKFSITGERVENIDLILNLYNDKKELCWTGRCVIHVVAASNPTKKILPIGDSLTNWKPYLPEVMLLSGQNITWVGTRYSGASVDSAGNSYASGMIHHEGRSGWGASSYLSNATYSFDTRYDGVSSVSGSANPFWDGSKFSLAHYLTTQTGVDTPDAVQIFLGTNDITTSVDDAITNITAMVTSIRAEYPSMPIFVCNTIYRSNQNGYGSVGGDAYAGGSGANAWQYDQDSKVMDLMSGLRNSLKDISGVYLVPLAACMDREYDFGQVATPVNPRCAVTVDMPAESVHPQPCGYYQMADVMYSAFCGVLT